MLHALQCTKISQCDEERCVVEFCFTRTRQMLIGQSLAAIKNAGFKLPRHPSYLPDIANSDFCLLPKLKEFKKDANLLTTKALSAWQMAGWTNKINNSSAVESELWRNSGPNKFQL